MDAASYAGAVAASGLYASQLQLGVAASNIANGQDNSGSPTGPSAPFGSSAVIANPTSGTQPGGVSGHAYNTLQTSLKAAPDGGVDATATKTDQPDDPTQQQLNLLAAQQAFQANVATLKADNLFNQATVNLVT